VKIDPARIEYVTDLISRDIVSIVIGLFLIMIIAIILTRAIVKAGMLPPPATLVTALSVLTLLSIAGGITTNNDEAWAIAAAGIGALAGSVSTVYQNTTDERLRQIETSVQPSEAPLPQMVTPEELVDEPVEETHWDHDPKEDDGGSPDQR
jgi:hypothetical protein